MLILFYPTGGIMSKSDILVLGGPATGKTHYAGQFLGRLRYNPQGEMKLKPGGADDLNKFEEVLGCLEEGRSAGHTPAETWIEMKCHLETRTGDEVLLEWPDYAGERLTSILERRLIPSQWRDSILTAQGWMLFIRPSTLKLYEDLLSRPAKLPPTKGTVDNGIKGGLGWDDRAQYVEILQILLYVAGVSNFKTISQPKLAIILSCWDELDEDNKTPEEVFKERLPLLFSFIKSTWEASSWTTWALSSLGRELDPDSRDEEYARQGPENFGYVIPPGLTEQNPDLTKPLAWLLEA